MAWSYRTRRTFTRTARRSFRRRSVARPRYNRRRWGARRVAKKTVSAVVNLSQDSVWNLFNPQLETTPDTRQWYPFAFTPGTVPGFTDYQTTYSHFRILKAKLYISRRALGVEGVTNNYLIVGSRPFAAVTLPGVLLQTLIYMFRRRRRLTSGRPSGRRFVTPARCVTWSRRASIRIP